MTIFFESQIMTKMPKKSKMPFVVAGAVAVLLMAISAAFMTGTRSPLYASGSVTIAPDLEASARGIRTLYVVALPAGGGRMPLGAARFSISADPQGKFHDFILTPETMTMMPGAAASGMPETFTIKARLDSDGAGGMDQPGDLTGEATEVHLGSKAINVTINRAVK